MARQGEKNITGFIDPEVARKFHEQCETYHYFKRVAIEAAIQLWTELSPEEQAARMRNESNSESHLRTAIEKALVEYGLIEATGHARPLKGRPVKRKRKPRQSP